ncbi:uncharacterized protein LOC119792399 [Cyprinodon tularosa]|uniref:uncharacterized protein LOC119792399 n=1 Tax=Cyprinodon tularosa TaxID=77115 RepID=UPI0018E26E59|nr:uncharacterized protein LOC119792399 [Cyprinodon tularosa]
MHHSCRRAHMFTMLLPVLLLLLSSTQASHFFGTVMTYYPKQTNADGSMQVFLRYKLSFRDCTDFDTWICIGSCGSLAPTLEKVDEESGGEWCQREGILTPVISPRSSTRFELDGTAWIDSIKNNIVRWKAVTGVELRSRSDTGKANISPQSTILPSVRVPSNCQRDFNLLAFDPDGDTIKCRYGSYSLSECNPCTPPSVLSLSPSCTLTFNRTSNINQGPYAVQMVMEDFPLQSITLTNVDGVQQNRTPSQAISKIPFQFVLHVDPVVPTCTEGLFLPKFLPPTPANKAKLFAGVNQVLDINIIAEAKNTTISELLFSGPSSVVKNSSGSGNFKLRWTPSPNEEEEHHPICFVVQSTLNSVKYHSELRCVIVHVTSVVARVNMKVFSSLPSFGGKVNGALLLQIKEELTRMGLPQDTILHVLKENSMIVNATATPVT